MRGKEHIWHIVFGVGAAVGLSLPVTSCCGYVAGPSTTGVGTKIFVSPGQTYSRVDNGQLVDDCQHE